MASWLASCFSCSRGGPAADSLPSSQVPSSSAPSSTPETSSIYAAQATMSPSHGSRSRLPSPSPSPSLASSSIPAHDGPGKSPTLLTRPGLAVHRAERTTSLNPRRSNIDGEDKGGPSNLHSSSDSQRQQQSHFAAAQPHTSPLPAKRLRLNLSSTPSTSKVSPLQQQPKPRHEQHGSQHPFFHHEPSGMSQTELAVATMQQITFDEAIVHGFNRSALAGVLAETGQIDAGAETLRFTLTPPIVS
ncbi:hypothetical protein BC831DRAFT_444824 [Entophlyctis helioformis]|nr:hypothetical protein BC831DRAFT_444824 [Entophlyctis helioformis]